MSKQVLLISDRPEDLRFFSAVCDSIGLQFDRRYKFLEVDQQINSGKKPIVIVDAQNFRLYQSIERSLHKNIPSRQLFSVTDKFHPFSTQMVRFRRCGHHLLRNFDKPALDLYAKLILSSVNEQTNTIRNFLPEKTDTKKIIIKHVAHKKAVIEAIQNVLTQKKVIDRLAALVAQSVDELILNSIFDAPVDQRGARTKTESERSIAFPLTPKEQIEVQLAITKDYMGVSVKDHFGSLNREIIIRNLASLRGSAVYNPSSPATKLGLNRVIQSGMSLIFISRPHQSTEAILFFKIADNYRSFKKSFQFVSTYFPPVASTQSTAAKDDD